MDVLNGVFYESVPLNIDGDIYMNRASHEHDVRKYVRVVSETESNEKDVHVRKVTERQRDDTGATVK